MNISQIKQIYQMSQHSQNLLVISLDSSQLSSIDIWHLYNIFCESSHILVCKPDLHLTCQLLVLIVYFISTTLL
jgi:hypothetical protein